MKNNKVIYIIIAVLVLMVIGGGLFFFFSNKGPQKEAQDQRPGEFSNGQQYATFKTDDFEVKYPNWPNIDRSKIAEADEYEVAVSNEGCNFIIKVSSVPPNTSFREYEENLLQEQMKQFPVKILIKDIKDTTAYFEGEVSMGNTIVKSVSHSYFTSKGQSVGFAFIAQNDQFERVCRPIIDEVVRSIKVK